MDIMHAVREVYNDKYADSPAEQAHHHNKIFIVGAGGVGKDFISATLVTFFRHRGRDITFNGSTSLLLAADVIAVAKRVGVVTTYWTRRLNREFWFDVISAFHAIDPEFTCRLALKHTIICGCRHAAEIQTLYAKCVNPVTLYIVNENTDTRDSTWPYTPDTFKPLVTNGRCYVVNNDGISFHQIHKQLCDVGFEPKEDHDVHNT